MRPSLLLPLLSPPDPDLCPQGRGQARGGGHGSREASPPSLCGLVKSLFLPGPWSHHLFKNNRKGCWTLAVFGPERMSLLCRSEPLLSGGTCLIPLGGWGGNEDWEPRTGRPGYPDLWLRTLSLWVIFPCWRVLFGPQYYPSFKPDSLSNF